LDKWVRLYSCLRQGRTMLPSGTVSSQQTTSGISNSVLQPSVTVTGNYQGSIPGTPIPVGPVRLSLPDAVKRGLQTNLGIVTSGVSSSIVRAQRAEALSQLFPQIGRALDGRCRTSGGNSSIHSVALSLLANENSSAAVRCNMRMERQRIRAPPSAKLRPLRCQQNGN
jgi:hypothetical protein